MAGKIFLLILFTLAIIGFEWLKRKETKKSIISVAIFIYIISAGYSGAILTRPIAPLFIIHLISLTVAYIGLMIYTFKNRFIWYLFITPLLTIALAFALNFLEGSRYEK